MGSFKLKLIQIILFCIFSSYLNFGFANSNTNSDRYINQFKLSVQHVISNLNITELNNSGAIIASPSKNAPNYFYHWVRDAGLTMLEITTLYDMMNDGNSKRALENRIWLWIDFEKKLQEKALSKSFLGEPIFTVSGDIYPFEWGRPQNDGPAIRALAMINFCESLLRQGRFAEARYLYSNELPAKSVIKIDLEYVASKWQEQNYDLWEEVKGQHFFTRMAQRASLIKGANLAEKIYDPKAAEYYRSKAKELTLTLRAHQDSNRKIIVPTLDQTDGWKHKSSQLDVSVILGSLYFALDDGFYDLNDIGIENTVNRLQDSFKNIYQVNHQHPEKAPAIGRYPEDVYNGNGFGEGNPWFLATNAYAEYYCRKSFISQNSTEKEQLRNYGLKFLDRSIFHVDPEGRMPEQFNRYSGYTQGAKDLTWSYISYSRAARYCFEGQAIFQ